MFVIRPSGPLASHLSTTANTQEFATLTRLDSLNGITFDRSSSFDRGRGTGDLDMRAHPMDGYEALAPHSRRPRSSPRVKAGPAAELASVEYRVRHDRIDKTRTVTLRYRSRLRHIPIGAAPRDHPVLLFVVGADVHGRD